MIGRTGTGFTEASRFMSEKSKKAFGQMNPSIEAPTWNAADVRMRSRAQWFLINFPIVENDARKSYRR